MEMYKLAKQMQEAPVPLGEGEPTYESIGTLIDASQSVWRKLQSQKFSENEFGHVRFNILDFSDYTENSGNRVDGIDVLFVDPSGTQTKLGRVVRDQKQWGSAKVKAFDHAADKKGVAITPTDPRWEAIVGSIKEAVVNCSSNQT